MSPAILFIGRDSGTFRHLEGFSTSKLIAKASVPNVSQVV